MTKQSKIAVLIAALVAVALAVGGFFFFANSGDDASVPSNTDISANPSDSASASPSASPTDNTAIPSSKASDPAAAQKEIDETRKFEDATEVENFTKEEVQKVLKTATEYSYNSLTNTYFLGGEWDEEKMPNNLDQNVGRFFTNDIRKKIMELDTNPETGKDIGTNVFPLVFFVRPNGNITPHEVCRTDYKGDSTISCPLDGLTFTDMKYVPTMEESVPGVRVTFSTTAKIPVKMDGTKDYYSEVTYSYDLNFIRNADFEESINPNEFVINWYQVKTDMSAVKEIQ